MLNTQFLQTSVGASLITRTFKTRFRKVAGFVLRLATQKFSHTKTSECSRIYRR